MSSSPPDETPLKHPSQSTSTSTPQMQPPANPHSVQATEQQLKARAEGVSIDDYLLPRTLTLRLAKSVLPPNTSIQKDAVLAIQKAATVFVSYLSSHANEATLKRTVTPADVFSAISELEFDGFRPRLERELDLFTEMKAAKRRGSSKKVDGDGNGVENGAAPEGKDGKVEVVLGEREEKEVVVRGAKRVKRDEGGGEVGVGRDVDEDEDGDEDDNDNGEDGEEEEHDENETEEEEEEEDDDEEVVEDDDIDRVEDLDPDARARRMVDPDDGDDTESDDEGPGSQLRGDLGLG
ncbi:histone-fold-containing protein [Aspergillus cavernicola]|uniref:DNA polymerase epsilon subunit D n=1 Tax=Aspergillus cavernicola TaxID=176166 RepID=A0ABR4IWW0_9EURO